LLTGISTASNWTFNFVVVMVTGPSFSNISWKTYIVFAALNAAIVPVVYFFFPETGGRSLEGEIGFVWGVFFGIVLLTRSHQDLDVVFALAHNEGLDPVEVSLRKDVPLAGSREADEILGVDPGARYYTVCKGMPTSIPGGEQP
jgi:hypothetical protein